MSLTTTQRFAAAEVLCDWPEHMDYDELCEAIEAGHEDVIISEVYDRYPASYVIDNMDGIESIFRRTVARMTEDLREAIKDGDQQAIADRMIALENELGV